MISTAKFNANLWSVSLYSSQPQSPNCLSKNQGRSTAGYTPTHIPKKSHLKTRERGTRNLLEVQGQTPNRRRGGAERAHSFPNCLSAQHGAMKRRRRMPVVTRSRCRWCSTVHETRGLPVSVTQGPRDASSNMPNIFGAAGFQVCSR